MSNPDFPSLSDLDLTTITGGDLASAASGFEKASKDFAAEAKNLNEIAHYNLNPKKYTEDKNKAEEAKREAELKAKSGGTRRLGG